MTEEWGEQVSLCDLGIWSGKMFPEPSAPTEEKTSQPFSKKPSASQSRKPPILKCLKKVGTPGDATTMKWEDGGNYERDATMASLFDGIGGFPLIWEQLNGRGTCLWASEIEEFPIAVTKRRFGTLEEPGDMGRFLFPCGEREKS